MEDVLFHPSLELSKLCAPDADLVEVATVLLHTIGWNTQQCTEKSAIESILELIQLDRTAVIKGCAAGVAALQTGIAQIP